MQVNFAELNKDLGVLRGGMTLVQNELEWHRAAATQHLEGDLYEVWRCFFLFFQSINAFSFK